MRPKILDRYLVQSYLMPFGASLGLFGMLVTVGRYFEKMGTFTSSNAGFRDILVYLLYGLPYWLNLILPIATLLGLLFSLGSLQQRGELTAMRGAGIAPARLWAPYFAMAFLFTAVSLAGGLTFLPKLNFESRSVYRVAIKKREAIWYRKDNIVAAGHDNRRFTIGWLDVDKGVMEQIVVDRFDGGFHWQESISAQRAVYENGRWKFVNGLLRRPDPDTPKEILEERFDERWVDLRERPQDFMVEDKHPDDMTGDELVRRVKRLRRLGASTDAEEMALHLKIALPFANLVVIGLGIPFAIRQGRKGRVQTFAYALGASFCYWGCVSVFESLGDQGMLPPWLAAWLPNVIFAGVAYRLFFRER